MNEEVRVVSADPTEAPVVGTSKTDSDTVSQPIKRRRVLSDKQREALSKGREKRWLQRQEQQKKRGDVDDEENDTGPTSIEKRESLSVCGQQGLYLRGFRAFTTKTRTRTIVVLRRR